MNAPRTQSQYAARTAKLSEPQRRALEMLREGPAYRAGATYECRGQRFVNSTTLLKLVEKGLARLKPGAMTTYVITDAGRDALAAGS